MLGEAAPPLVAEPEDRAGGPGGRERPKGALARLIAFAGPRKARSAAAIMEVGSAEAEPESERALGKRGDEDTRADPLVAEPEDRAGGPGGRERPKGALARLIAFARPRKAKAAAAIMEAGSAEAEPESETALGKRGDEHAGADTIVVPAAGATAVGERGGIRRRERGASNGQTPSASLCAQRRDRGRRHDGGRGGGDRGSELAAWFASAGRGAGHARGSADEGDGAVGRVGDGSAEGRAKCRWRAAAGA